MVQRGLVPERTRHDRRQSVQDDGLRDHEATQDQTRLEERVYLKTLFKSRVMLHIVQLNLQGYYKHVEKIS